MFARVRFSSETFKVGGLTFSKLQRPCKILPYLNSKRNYKGLVKYYLNSKGNYKGLVKYSPISTLREITKAL